MASNRKIPPLNKVVKQLIDDGKEFFVNSLLKPVVQIPDDPYQKVWEVTDVRFLAHVSSVYHSLTNEYLKSSERDMLIELLKEECYKGGRRMTEVEAALIEKDSIVQAVLIYLSNGKDGFDGLTRDLLVQLRADFIQVRIVPPDPDFPVLTNIFSRRLNQLVPALKELGISSNITHGEEGSRCKLQKLGTFKSVTDAANTNASGQSSGATIDAPKGTAAPDWTEGADGCSGKEHPYVNRSTDISK